MNSISANEYTAQQCLYNCKVKVLRTSSVLCPERSVWAVFLLLLSSQMHLDVRRLVLEVFLICTLWGCTLWTLILHPCRAFGMPRKGAVEVLSCIFLITGRVTVGLYVLRNSIRTSSNRQRNRPNKVQCATFQDLKLDTLYLFFNLWHGGLSLWLKM